MKNEYENERILNMIANMSREIKKCSSIQIKKKLLLQEELLKKLDSYGGYVLIKEENKKLKTKDKHICTYMTKWGNKFQIIEDIEYYKVTNVQIKLLTKYDMNQPV